MSCVVYLLAVEADWERERHTLSWTIKYGLSADLGKTKLVLPFVEMYLDKLTTGIYLLRSKVHSSSKRCHDLKLW